MTDHKHKTRLVTGGLGKTNGTTDIANDADIVNHFIQKINPCAPRANPHKGWNLFFSGVRKLGSFWINLTGVFESRDIQALRPLKPLRPLQKKPLKPLQKKPLKPLKPLKKRKQTEKPCGYNATSLKSRLYPAQLGGFVLPSNNGAMRAHKRSCTRTTLGVWAIGNDPADRVGESTPTLTGGFQSQNHGGQHG